MTPPHWVFDALTTDAPLDPALVADFLGLCGELLTAAFLVVQAQAPSLARQQTLAHLGAALGEVEAARGWQGEETEDMTTK